MRGDRNDYVTIFNSLYLALLPYNVCSKFVILVLLCCSTYLNLSKFFCWKNQKSFDGCLSGQTWNWYFDSFASKADPQKLFFLQKRFFCKIHIQGNIKWDSIYAWPIVVLGLNIVVIFVFSNQVIVNKFWPGLDSNRGSLVSIATTLSTEPHNCPILLFVLSDELLCFKS